MMKPRLPRSVSQAWPGGFVFEQARTITRVAAGAGTVLAAGDALYLLRPGATSFSTREIPADLGDVAAVAVEPRRPARFAVAGMDAVLIFRGEHVDRVRLHDQEAEVGELAWGPSDKGTALALYALLSDETVLRITPETGEIDELDVPPVDAMAADEAGNLVLACFDEESWSLDIYTMGRSGSSSGTEAWLRCLEAPNSKSLVELAVAGPTVAVSFLSGAVWVSRGLREPFVEVGGLLGGGPVAFQGIEDNAALFGVDEDERAVGIVRKDAAWTALQIAEIHTAGGAGPRIGRLAWDASHQTLWAAAGEAGLLCSTAPGAKVPFGAGALS
jgi:hypothetical protein